MDNVTNIYPPSAPYESLDDKKGDFIGFQFGGVHSSSLGIVRVSDGNRYGQTLLPSFNDTVVDVPGEDGVYFFGQKFKQKPFTLNIAFDEVSEEQLRQMSQLFGTGNVSELIFDERPYKIWNVKVSKEPQLKYICFDKTDGERVYKGEGTIELVTMGSPFARSRWESKEEAGQLDLDYELDDTEVDFNDDEFLITIHTNKSCYLYLKKVNDNEYIYQNFKLFGLPIPHPVGQVNLSFIDFEIIPLYEDIYKIDLSEGNLEVEFTGDSRDTFFGMFYLNYIRNKKLSQLLSSAQWLETANLPIAVTKTSESGPITIYNRGDKPISVYTVLTLTQSSTSNSVTSDPSSPTEITLELSKSNSTISSLKFTLPEVSTGEVWDNKFYIDPKLKLLKIGKAVGSQAPNYKLIIANDLITKGDFFLVEPDSEQGVQLSVSISDDTYELSELKVEYHYLYY